MRTTFFVNYFLKGSLVNENEEKTHLEMRKLNNFLLLILFIVRAIDSLQIISIEVPAVIQNGSRASVLLDCEYRYEQYEVHGLEIKWFWNQEPEPIYQWIPGKKPEAMGILKGRVNLRHRASKDRNSVHRAIEILEPTIELTGHYKCRVSSFHDEDMASKKMIVYSPATSMNMTFEKVRKRSVDIYCFASCVYPEPSLKLVLPREDDGDSRIIKPLDLELTENEDGSYNVSLEAKVKDKNLPTETLMQCVLEIPGTPYRIRRQVVYFPGYEYRGYDIDDACSNPSSKFSLVFFMIIFPSYQLMVKYILN